MLLVCCVFSFSTTSKIEYGLDLNDSLIKFSLRKHIFSLLCDKLNCPTFWAVNTWLTELGVKKDPCVLSSVKCIGEFCSMETFDLFNLPLIQFSMV